jgi:hypothetical protein
VTLNLYGHLFPSLEEHLTDALEEYLTDALDELGRTATHPWQREISRYDNDTRNPSIRPKARCHR